MNLYLTKIMGGGVGPTLPLVSDVVPKPLVSEGLKYCNLIGCSLHTNSDIMQDDVN